MTKQQTWNRFKAKSIELGKTVTRVAIEVPCSTRAIRAAVIENRCPRVRNRLKEMGLVSK